MDRVHDMMPGKFQCRGTVEIISKWETTSFIHFLYFSLYAVKIAGSVRLKVSMFYELTADIPFWSH